LDEVSASSQSVVAVLRTGDLARRAGIGKATLEHYLRLGLIQPIDTGTQGYRLFDEDAIARVRVIRSGRRAGFTLPELGAILRVVPAADADELFSTLPPAGCRAELARRGVAIDV
jgi:DNA-binding transcriptional MerR regulator